VTKFRALIIDDIDNSRITLAHDLKEYCPKISVVGEADSVKKGLQEILEKKPDVVFLDIQMGDGTGFDLLNQLKEINFQIIFTTALDTYGIQAIKFSALDYLLKPIDPDELVKAVGKLEQTEKTKSVKDSINLLLENMRDNITPGNKRIALHSLEKVHLVPVSDIIRCESQGAYTIFHLKNKEQLLVTKNLKEYEDMLEPHSFIRVHHSHLINFAYLKEYIKKDGGYAIMMDKSEVPVSFRKRSHLLDIIGGA
jgi:two-component system LytT family response regulator